MSDSEEEFVGQDDVESVVPADSTDWAPEPDFGDDSVQGFFGHSGPVYSVAIHPLDALTAASGSGDDTSCLWRVDSGAKIANLAHHSDSCVAVAFSSDGSYIASGGMDGCIYVFTGEGAPIRCLDGPSEIVWIDWHPRGNILLAGSDDGSVWMWALPSGVCMNVFTGHSEAVTCGCFSPDGKRIITGSSDGTIIIWDPKTAAALVRLSSNDDRFHQSGITSLQVNKDSTLLLSGGIDGSVRLIHAVNGKILACFDSHSDSVEAISFSSAMPYAATGSVDGSLCVWDLTLMRLRHSCQGHTDAITRVKWTDSVATLVSSSMDSTVREWDGRTGEQTNIFQGHSAPVLDIATRGNLIVSASDDHGCLVFPG